MEDDKDAMMPLVKKPKLAINSNIYSAYETMGQMEELRLRSVKMLPL